MHRDLVRRMTLRALATGGALALLAGASVAPGLAAQPAREARSPSISATAPGLDWGETKIEYYTGGVVLGYAKGEDAAVRILGSNTCFYGDWVGKGHWTGQYSSAGGVWGNDGDVTWHKGKTLTVKLPKVPLDATYKRTTAKKAAKVWGSKARAKAALKKCSTAYN